jgi:predicted MFS family arabinose efflux permease
MRVIAKMVGTAFMFLGFLQVFLSISGGFELSGVVALLLYFGGLAIWANAVIEQPMLRWGITIGAIAVSLAFLHFGEILFWHKQVVFWATVVIVMYFMFNEPKKPQ